MLDVTVVGGLAESLSDEELETWLILFQREWARRKEQLVVCQEVEVAAPC